MMTSKLLATALAMSLLLPLAQAQDTVAQDTAALAYRDAVETPPPGWTGPVFRLSHDYPTEAPAACDVRECPWLATNQSMFSQAPGSSVPVWDAQWSAYMKKIFDYIKDGQDPMLSNQKGWDVKVGGKTRWYHVPWMSYDPTRGREFVHGLTNERTATISDFHKPLDHHFGLNTLQASVNPNAKFETWAFGVYNDYGAYSIGKSWGKDGLPQVASYDGVRAPAGLPFATGTVVAKLLFTTASEKDAPYLKGSPAWQADRHVMNGQNPTCERKVQVVHLVQMDIAVVDPNSPGRWVFGTYIWDGNRPGKTAWDHLVPVGLQWGADPWTFPAVPRAESIPVRQSVLNPRRPNAQTGCQGRLAGPVDNKQSSCLSCHGGAFASTSSALSVPTGTPPIFGFPGLCTQYSLENAQYFNNVQFPQGYTGGQYPDVMNLDTSLQLQVSFFQYAQYKHAGKPAACTQ